MSFLWPWPSFWDIVCLFQESWTSRFYLFSHIFNTFFLFYSRLNFGRGILFVRSGQQHLDERQLPQDVNCCPTKIPAGQRYPPRAIFTGRIFHRSQIRYNQSKLKCSFALNWIHFIKKPVFRRLKTRPKRYPLIVLCLLFSPNVWNHVAGTSPLYCILWRRKTCPETVFQSWTFPTFHFDFHFNMQVWLAFWIKFRTSKTILKK